MTPTEPTPEQVLEASAVLANRNGIAGSNEVERLLGGDFLAISRVLIDLREQGRIRCYCGQTNCGIGTPMIVSKYGGEDVPN